MSIAASRIEACYVDDKPKELHDLYLISHIPLCPKID